MLRPLIEKVAEGVPLSVYRLTIRRDVLGLYYHVVSDHSLPHIRHLFSYKSASMFENDLTYLAKHFNLIGYEQLVAHRSGGQRLKPRSLILTFDDGLSECYSVVRPLLLKHGVPGVFFVTTNYVDNHEMMSVHKASLCIDQVASLGSNVLPDIVKSANDALGTEWVSGTELIDWVRSNAELEPSVVDGLCRLLGIDVRQYLETERPYLSSDEIRSLARDGFTIGAHSTRHQEYGSLAESEVENDIVASCDAVRSLSGQSDVPFAFPSSADRVSRDLLLELRNKHKPVGLLFGTSGIRADRDFMVNRMCGDRPADPDREQSNLSERLVRAYIEELSRRVRRQREPVSSQLVPSEGKRSQPARHDPSLRQQAQGFHSAADDVSRRQSEIVVLVISARFPPYHLGGYEIRGKDIVEGLSSRGHKISVFTSRSEAGSNPSTPIADYTVTRQLRVRIRTNDFIERLAQRRGTYFIGMFLTFMRELLWDMQELRLVDREIERLQPDVIYLGHVSCLTRSLVPHLAERREPIVYDEGGTGLIDCWTEKNVWYKLTDEHVSRHRVFAPLKSFVVGAICRLSAGRLRPRFAWPSNMHIFFNDDLGYRNAVAKRVPLREARVIHSGVQTKRFSYRPRMGLGSPVRLLVPGRIESRKGQLDGVRLIAELSRRGMDARMVLVGAVWSDSYYRELTREVGRLRLEDKVRFLPMVPQDELAALYREADICLFPSYFRTGFSRVPLEAMASGCIIVSYGNEGSDEVIRHRQNGFLVEPGNPSGIADTLAELAAEPELVRNITGAARREIEEKHSMQAYVDRVEDVLIAAALSGRHRDSGDQAGDQGCV